MLLRTYPPDLADQIRQRVAGEVRFDQYSRILYSTDASLWQMEPIGVVIPRDHDDVAAVADLAARNKVPLLPRGGATSLSGQTEAANLLGASDRVGSLQAGRFADVVAVTGDPLKDISELQRITFVMKGGVVYKQTNMQGPSTAASR